MERFQFVSEQAAVRVVFGAGAIDRLADEVERLGRRRPFVVATPGRRLLADTLTASLKGLSVAVHTHAVMHVPIEAADAGRAAADQHAADCLVAIGGGSAIGLAKAIALQTGWPIVAVPTTYSGSEMTPVYGLVENTVKRTGRDAKAQPKTVLYDPVLTIGLPPQMSATSGMNAMAHCVEALYARDANPVTTLLAGEGIRALNASLPVVVREGGNLSARSEALYGAWLAGSTLASTTMGLHHKLCHTVSGTFNLPHAAVHTVILPHAAAFNREAAPESMQIAAAALNVADAPSGLFDLAERMGAPTSLKQLGMPIGELDRAARLATQNPYDNPRPVDYDGVRALLERAFHGTRPSAF